MAKYDQGDGCACGLYKHCQCGHSPAHAAQGGSGGQSIGGPIFGTAVAYDHLGRPVGPNPTTSSVPEKVSVTVLRECIDLQRSKGADYQSAASTVRQADYYVSGIRTIYETMHAKMLRIRSLMEAGADPAHEAMEDSAKDLINYSSFLVAYLRGGIDGQSPDRDHFNVKKFPIT